MTALRGAPAPTAEMPAATPSFAFLASAGARLGQGVAAVLPRGPAATLGARVAAHFRAAGPGTVLAGALPFAREDEDYLIQPRALATALPPVAAAAPRARWHLAHQPDATGYAAAVRRALDMLEEEATRPGGLAKIVLARSLLATADAAIDPLALLRRLATDPAATGFLVPLPPQADGAPRWLAGATPELLVEKRGARIRSHPLAGSARRQADASADAAAAAALTRSDKDRREHMLVADCILDTLAPLCRSLSAPQGTTLTRTRSLWHLGTAIEGELKDPDLSSAALAALLHPTPAVCGLPRARAAQLIREIEPIDRGFYAGAVGWCDAAGDGAWHVAIRCAEVSGATARLFAGAGIVPGSDPVAEAAETGAKYGALLAALGIELEEGR